MTTEFATGTLSISGGTDTDLGSESTTAGIFEAHLDVTNLVAGQFLVVKAWSKIVSGGSTLLADEWHLGPLTPGDPHWVSPPLAAVHAWKFTAAYDGGSATSFPWSIVQLDG